MITAGRCPVDRQPCDAPANISHHERKIGCSAGNQDRDRVGGDIHDRKEIKCIGARILNLPGPCSPVRVLEANGRNLVTDHVEIDHRVLRPHADPAADAVESPLGHVRNHQAVIVRAVLDRQRGVFRTDILKLQVSAAHLHVPDDIERRILHPEPRIIV